MADFADRELDHGVNGNFQPDDPSGLENPIVEEVQDSMVFFYKKITIIKTS